MPSFVCLKNLHHQAEGLGMDTRDQEGFSLVELMIVIMIIALLMAIAIPTYLGARQRAQDRAAQSMLVTALKTEEVVAVDDAQYTNVVATLSAAEPALDWAGVADDSVHIVVGTTVNANDTVLLYAKSSTGSWVGIKRIAQGATTGVYTCLGAARADVDDLADCTGTEW